MRLRLSAFIFAVVLLSAGCAAHVRHYPPNYSNPVYTVAILPFYNVTNDVNGPMTIRQEFLKRMEGMNYSVMPIKEVDRVLMEQMGITLGSQLELTNPAQLGEILGVDGVVYGYVLDFDDITTGVYNVKKVRAGFKLVNTRTGEAMWTGGHGVKSLLAGGDAGAGITVLKELKGDGIEQYRTIQGLEDIQGIKEWQIIRAGETKKAGDAAAIALGEKILTKALGFHLWLETDTMLKKSMKGFPIGPGSPRHEKRNELSNKEGGKS